MSLESLFTRSWYGRCGWTYVFRPLQPLIRSHVRNKRQAFLDFPERSYRALVPVVVVGNISIGGTGKSPMVVALCELLLAQGYRPGIVSRGHGVKVKVPTQVTPDSSALDVGDEPVMLARRTACPMVVFPKRDEAVKHLLATHDVNIIICDDGMQHYQLHRDIEVAMLDASRGLGNGQLLPVGPLREPIERLSSVDFVVSVTSKMTLPLQQLPVSVVLTALASTTLVSLNGDRQRDAQKALLEEKSWHIMAGIGNPERFLATLSQLGLDLNTVTHQWFNDHHVFTATDIPQEGAVLMTEKDAVKCKALGLRNSNIWYLPVSLVLPESFKQAFLEKLNTIKAVSSYE